MAPSCSTRTQAWPNFVIRMPPTLEVDRVPTMLAVTLPDGVTLRTATLDDVEAGAALHAACWRETYAGLVDPARLEERLADTERWRTGWATQIEAGPPRVLAAAEDDELIGFGVAGPSRKEDAPVDPGALRALHPSPPGGAAASARRCSTWWRRSGPCWLFVLEGNGRAQAFYRRNGFAADGHRQRYAGLDAWEIRMVRRITACQEKHGRSILHRHEQGRRDQGRHPRRGAGPRLARRLHRTDHRPARRADRA